MRTHYRSPIFTSPTQAQDGTKDDEEDEGREIDKTKTWGTGPRKIDLRGPRGNRMILVGKAMAYAKQVDMPEAERKAMTKDMLCGDYLHVLETFEKHWGAYTTLFYGDGTEDDDGTEPEDEEDGGSEDEK